MFKKILPILLLPLLLGGCSTSFTNLTPQQMPFTSNNLYPVDVAFHSTDATLRWDSVKPQIVVNNQIYPMQLTPMMTNRWEGLIPVPQGTGAVIYRFKFDYLKNSFGPPLPNSVLSKEFVLKILNQ